MNRRTHHWCAGVACTAAFMCGIQPVVGDECYELQALGTLGGAESFALNINESGTIVGLAERPGGDAHAVMWVGGVITDLGTLGADPSSAYDINNAGRIVGQTNTNFVPPTRVGFFSDPDYEELIPLDNFPFHFNGIARTVNEAGQMAGTSIEFDFLRPAVWFEDGSIAPLPTFLDQAAAQGDVWDSNDANDLVGWSLFIDTDSGFFGWRAALWPFGDPNGTIIELGTLGGSTSFARGINNEREVVGTAGLAEGQVHAFRYKSAMLDLGDLGPGTIAVSSVAQDINDAGRIVGYSQVFESSHFEAFLWEDGLMHNLNDLIPADSGWLLTEAHAINESGQIVGRGIDPNTFERGFVLTPTDPATCLSTPCGLNGDNTIDAADLAILLGAWGPNPASPADLNSDGTVNAADLALLLGTWGPCA